MPTPPAPKGTTMTRTRHALCLAAACLAFAAALLLAQDKDKGKANQNAYPFVFTDYGDKAGLFPDAAKIRGHGAAWGDVDGDGYIDLYISTFAGDGSGPNLFFRNNKGKFVKDDQKV